jgi:hypothetical protein
MSKVSIGSLDEVAADCISGWAGFQGEQDPVVVEIYLDDEKVWECVADRPRPVIAKIGVHHARCGFLITDQLSSTVAPRRIYAKIRGATGFLEGSGRLLQPVSDVRLKRSVARDPDSTLRAIGSLDRVADGTIAGWAAIEGQDGPVTVEIFLDHRKLTECVTGEERQDVTKNSSNVGSHSGFSTLYNAAQATYQTRIYASVRGSQKFLHGSGRFAEPPKGPKLFFLHIPKTGGTTINGIAELLYERAITHIEIRPNTDLLSFADYDFISAHWPFAMALSIYGEYQYNFVTIVREPLFQFQSHLAHLRTYGAHQQWSDPNILQAANILAETEPDLSGQVACIKSLSREPRIRRAMNSLFDNCITRFLASVDAGTTVGPKDVDRAKEALLQLNFVGVTSLFPETLKKLGRLSGKPWHEYSSVRLNKGARKTALVGDNQNGALVDEFIWADNEIYQMALALFRQNRA